MTAKCWFGIHLWGKPFWRWHDGCTFSWHRKCQRCGKQRIELNPGYILPPVRFVDGVEEFLPGTDPSKFGNPYGKDTQ